MKNLLLIDGTSYLYRAYHALPDLRSPDGKPTGALYGVLNMLRRIHNDYTVDYSACVFDAKGPTFRHEWYPQYKATRPPMPEDLRVQIPPLYEAIQAMGWPFLVIDGVEADDVIGTLARQAHELGIQTLISTGDKDLTQLVRQDTTVINTMTGEKLDETGVEKKFGVPPSKIIDFLTLTGDKIDNIPGVDKCGPKTAIKWLNQYETLENITRQADNIQGQIGENLRLALKWLPLSKKLVTIKCDLDLGVSPDQLTYQEPDRTTLDKLFQQAGFKSWIIPQVSPESSPEISLANRPHRHYETITSITRLIEWIKLIEEKKYFCVDTETNSLRPMDAKIVGFSLSVIPHQAAYVPLAHIPRDPNTQLSVKEALDLLKPVLENPNIGKIGQNLKYDRHVFMNYGIKPEGIVHDTMLQSYVLEPHHTHNMDDLSRRHLHEKTITYEEVAGKG
ncbi:MAG: DNA polymerase I, partial [Pseudomonadota bacterium]|nr:DNA polymerase I [Pseudomonadota bacterium]